MLSSPHGTWLISVMRTPGCAPAFLQEEQRHAAPPFQANAISQRYVSSRKPLVCGSKPRSCRSDESAKSFSARLAKRKQRRVLMRAVIAGPEGSAVSQKLAPIIQVTNPAAFSGRGSLIVFELVDEDAAVNIARSIARDTGRGVTARRRFGCN